MGYKKLSKNSLVAIVECNPTEFGIFNGKPSYDEFSITKLPSRAIHKIGGILKQEGWTNVHYINPIYHGKHKRFSQENLKLIFNSDILCISSITRTAPQSMKLAELYRLQNPHGIIIAGGPDPTARQEKWLNYVDIVVRKEALGTIPILFPRLIQDKENLDGIKGIAFKKEEKVISSDPRFLTTEELGRVAYPDYDEKTRKGVNIATIETTIGCPHDCPYCGVTDFYGKRYRCKPINYSINELQMLHNIKMGHGFFFVDDNFAANPKRTKEFLQEMIDRKLNKKFGIAQVTVKASKDEELLDLMYKAKIRHICVGFESSNDENLKFLGKPFNSRMNEEAAIIFRKHKLHVHGMFMVGGRDTEESLREELEFAKRHTDSSQFFAISPVPGTRFYKQMQQENRILSNDFSLYDGHNVLVRPENEQMPPYRLQKKTQYMNEEYYSLENNIKRLKTSPNFKTSLGLLIYTCPPASGVSRVFKSKQMKAHLEFLKSIS